MRSDSWSCHLHSQDTPTRLSVVVSSPVRADLCAEHMGPEGHTSIVSRVLATLSGWDGIPKATNLPMNLTTQPTVAPPGAIAPAKRERRGTLGDAHKGPLGRPGRRVIRIFSRLLKQKVRM
jgi:hypothetical protein